MAKTKLKIETAPPAVPTGPRPRLHKLIVRNYRSIGPDPVVVDLDDIVVLVGPNNAGKSTILKAFELVVSEGSADGEILLDDFPNSVIDANALPTIELQTIVYDNSPGEKWVGKTENNELLVREKWIWSAPGKPTRYGFLAQEGRWADHADPEKVPWGTPNVANSRRPEAHRIDAFASPEKQVDDIIKLITSVLKERLKTRQSESNENSKYRRLLSSIAELQKEIVLETKTEVEAIQTNLESGLKAVFPKHRVIFDARPEDDLDKAISLFKANPQLLIGKDGGHLATFDKQGSGARRTLIWSSIRLLAEMKKSAVTTRPHVLLFDEPELCLHPSAIRDAVEALYKLPVNSKGWQVMVTSHSPCFIDFARDHTSIVRVERNAAGEIKGTTIFRPEKADFDVDDVNRLKLLNICDPYVAEFFFGGFSIIVEGDTEYTAFGYVKKQYPDQYSGVHIIRARGKATIVSLCKILNQFKAPYAVLHDSDRPHGTRKSKTAKNPAWAHNQKILDEVKKATSKVRLIASVPNFEEAYFGSFVESEKPYNALEEISKNQASLDVVKKLLDSLINEQLALPPNAVQYESIDDLELLAKSIN